MDLRGETIKQRQRLISHWTRRLIEEYENTLFIHRIKLDRPIIQVLDLENKWGLWDSETRTITIARQLIEKHPWDVVIQILKHEMAHQLVMEVMGSREIHGPEFFNACSQLGVCDWARAASGDLPGGIKDWRQEPSLDAEDRLLKRVEKLLALASSSNEHEAALAMQRVQEIYARHNLDRLQHHRSVQMVSLIIQHGMKRLLRHHALICSLLNDFFFVRIINVPCYDSASLVEYRGIEILGTRENVLMAEYVYHFLMNQLRGLWDSYRSSHPAQSRNRTSFYAGVLAGFRQKLEKSQKENPHLSIQKPNKGSTAIVHLRDKALDEFVHSRHPRLSTSKGSYLRYDAHSYGAGRAEGERIVIHRGISSHEGNRGRLLTS